MDLGKLGLEEIKLKDFENIKIGHSQNLEAATGVTALIAPEGMAAACDVRGGGPASRETPLLLPLASAKVIHAIILSGGSAFGLEASCGAAEYLEEKGIGFETGYAKVPLVCQSCIYDLCVGRSDVRPDKKMGREACENAFKGGCEDEQGIVGAGTGATVGKPNGAEGMMKSGLGSFAFKMGKLKVGAIVAVNALGDIFDYESGKEIAGHLNKEKTGFESCEEVLLETLKNADRESLFATNTTIGIIITNAEFNKMELQRVASQGHNAYAKTIRPVHTSADGDSIYAVSCGKIQADLDMVAALGKEAMGRAINNALLNAESCYGLLSAKDLK